MAERRGADGRYRLEEYLLSEAGWAAVRGAVAGGVDQREAEIGALAERAGRETAAYHRWRLEGLDRMMARWDAGVRRAEKAAGRERLRRRRRVVEVADG